MNYPYLKEGLPCSSTILAEARLVGIEIPVVILTSVAVSISEGVTSLRSVGRLTW
ncbi:MAG: hypothetical protein ACFFDI_13455 [Promethearchaeota archaeon]